MNDRLDVLLERMHALEREFVAELQRKEREYSYRVRAGRVRFERSVRERHRTLVKTVWRYVRESRLLVILTGPLIWACLLPIAALDLVASLYRLVCFPIYGIPKVRRREHVIVDRHRLAYLNVLEKLYCVYCGYANGVLAYVSEIGARTEQHWCPIKHALRIRTAHDRYRKFFEYGDAEGYRRAVEQVRRDFADLEDEDAA